jgi:hypothetical protein
MEPFVLVSPRVEDATVMVKGSNIDHACERCRKTVLVSPDSQDFIAVGLISEIVCLRCMGAELRRRAKGVGAEEEPPT